MAFFSPNYENPDDWVSNYQKRQSDYDQILKDQQAAVEQFETERKGLLEKLNEPFLHFMRRGKPLVMLKSAVTLDGKIATPEDNSGWITSEKARAHVQGVRHHSDAIATGIGTLLADDCLLNDRSGLERSRPLLRIVLDSVLRIPLHSKMVSSCNGDLLVATTSAASTVSSPRVSRRSMRASSRK